MLVVATTKVAIAASDNTAAWRGNERTFFNGCSLEMAAQYSWKLRGLARGG